MTESLRDDHPIRLVGVKREFTAGELRLKGYTEPELQVLAGFRAAPEPVTEATAAQLAMFATELAKRDDGFIRVVSTDVSRTVGKGMYLTNVDGVLDVRERVFTFDKTSGEIFEPQARPATLEALGGYTEGIAALRLAASTPTSDFEATWKAARAREFADQAARAIAEAPKLVVLSDAERRRFAPPNPYEADLQAWRARDARAAEAKEARR